MSSKQTVDKFIKNFFEHPFESPVKNDRFRNKIYVVEFPNVKCLLREAKEWAGYKTQLIGIRFPHISFSADIFVMAMRMGRGFAKKYSKPEFDISKARQLEHGKEFTLLDFGDTKYLISRLYTGEKGVGKELTFREALFPRETENQNYQKFKVVCNKTTEESGVEAFKEIYGELDQKVFIKEPYIFVPTPDVEEPCLSKQEEEILANPPGLTLEILRKKEMNENDKQVLEWQARHEKYLEVKEKARGFFSKRRFLPIVPTKNSKWFTNEGYHYVAGNWKGTNFSREPIEFKEWNKAIPIPITSEIGI